MADAEEHAPNEWLLKHISRGQVLQVELLRLSDRVPAPFLEASDVLFDFAYLKASEEYDARVESSAELGDAWDELRDAHAALVARFYQARLTRLTRSQRAARSSAHARPLHARASGAGHP